MNQHLALVYCLVAAYRGKPASTFPHAALNPHAEARAKRASKHGPKAKLVAVSPSRLRLTRSISG